MTIPCGDDFCGVTESWHFVFSSDTGKKSDKQIPWCSLVSTKCQGSACIEWWWCNSSVSVKFSWKTRKLAEWVIWKTLRVGGGPAREIIIDGRSYQTWIFFTSSRRSYWCRFLCVYSVAKLSTPRMVGNSIPHRAGQFPATLLPLFWLHLFRNVAALSSNLMTIQYLFQLSTRSSGLSPGFKFNSER